MFMNHGESITNNDRFTTTLIQVIESNMRNNHSMLYFYSLLDICVYSLYLSYLSSRITLPVDFLNYFDLRINVGLVNTMNYNLLAFQGAGYSWLGELAWVS